MTKISRNYMRAIGSLYGEAIQPLKKRRKANYVEHKHGTALTAWAKALDLPLIHLANEGKRSPQEGARLKAMGLVPGASDYFLARTTKRYPGMWLELKPPGKKPTPAQYAFLERMTAEGYLAIWEDDWERAKRAIEQYLGGDL